MTHHMLHAKSHNDNHQARIGAWVAAQAERKRHSNKHRAPAGYYRAVRRMEKGESPEIRRFNTRCGAQSWCMKGRRARVENSFGDTVWAWVNGREIEIARVDHPNTPEPYMPLLDEDRQEVQEPSIAATAH